MPPSKAWSFFKRSNDDKNVKCKLCDFDLVYMGGASNVLNHIRLNQQRNLRRPQRKHPVLQWTNLWIRQIQKHFQPHRQKLWQMLKYVSLFWIICRYTLFRARIEISKLMTIIAPEYKVLSRNTIEGVRRQKGKVIRIGQIWIRFSHNDAWTSNSTKKLHHSNRTPYWYKNGSCNRTFRWTEMRNVKSCSNFLNKS